MKTFKYQAFGLTINSDIELPMLPDAEKYARTDITVSKKNIAKSKLKKAPYTGLWFQESKNKYKLHVPGFALFQSNNGNQISYHPDSTITDTSMTALPHFILNECMAFLLKQRGNTVFSGMAINYKQHAILFTGNSLTGKSLLAAKMQNLGYQVICDAICCITPENKILYGYPFLKIWADCFKALDIKKGTLTRVRPNIEKYYFPLKQQQPSRKSLPVRAIYNISINKFDDESVSITPITGIDKMVGLEALLYGNNRYGYKNGGPNFSPELTSLAKQVSLNRVQRHHEVKLEYLVKTIEQSLESIFSNKK